MSQQDIVKIIKDTPEQEVVKIIKVIDLQKYRDTILYTLCVQGRTSLLSKLEKEVDLFNGANIDVMDLAIVSFNKTLVKKFHGMGFKYSNIVASIGRQFPAVMKIPRKIGVERDGTYVKDDGFIRNEHRRSFKAFLKWRIE